MHKFVHISGKGAHPLTILRTFYVNIVHQFWILSDRDWLTLFSQGGGALSATVFGHWLLLLNSFTNCIETS